MLVLLCAQPQLNAAPQWIWPASRLPKATACFRHNFEIKSAVDRALLTFQGEAARTTVYINGKPAAITGSYAAVTQIDITGMLNYRGNTIAVQCDSAEGAAAFFAHLKIEAPGAAPEVIETSSRWLAEFTPQPQWQTHAFNDRKWRGAKQLGAVGRTVFDPDSTGIAINPLDDYTQWKQALVSKDAGDTQASTSADPATFQVAPGYSIELLRSAGKDEGSWVSLTFDPQGRIIIGREDQGLLRLKLDKNGARITQVETINNTLKECRGLVFSGNDLFANANNSKALYRLRDTNGDDLFDEVKKLFASTGGVGHGRNCVAVDDAGAIYSIHGDSVDLPRNVTDRTSPHRQHRRGAKTSEGHLLRVNPSNGDVTVMAAGLRNPFGIDINRHGDLFTYDADAEHDMGAAWYRPTRVVHIAPGGDYGWRGVTGAWPAYYPDHAGNAAPALDIGKGSPTAVMFGYRAGFTPEHDNALFVLDWAYGRILAVHCIANGSSYQCRAETFVKGRPFNVTGVSIGPQGGMYVVTGGRKTQSGLYRITYNGPAVQPTAATQQQRRRAKLASSARRLRRQLEQLHQPVNAAQIELAWKHLQHPDPHIRTAARIAIEHQPLESWQPRAVADNRPHAVSLTCMMLASSHDPAAQSSALKKLNSLHLKTLPASGMMNAIRAYSLCLTAQEKTPVQVRQTAANRLSQLFPLDLALIETPEINRRLSLLLAELPAEDFTPKAMQQLITSTAQRDRFHYLYVLRNQKTGWNNALRRQYFQVLHQARYFAGGRGMPIFLKAIRKDAVATLTQAERKTLGGLIAEKQSTRPAPPQREQVANWQVEDIPAILAASDNPPDYRRGSEMFVAASCNRCHTVGAEGDPVGPDLTSVGRRFGAADLLHSIIKPSAVIDEAFQSVQIETRQGQIYTGRILGGGDYRSPEIRLATSPAAPAEFKTIAKRDIVSTTASPISWMPSGLLNTLSRDEVRDLIAYLQAGGNPSNSIYQQTKP